MVNSSDRHTAVLVFIRTAAKEATHKSFGFGISRNQNYRVASLLNQNAQKIAAKTGLPTYTIDSTKQIGKSFGERLGNAIQSVFQKGYENIIVIGNDCLSLSTQTILQAHQTLKEKDLVLGPDQDGGVYLIGINKKAFYQKSFESLPWQTNSLLESFIQLTNESNFSVHSLNELADANNAIDFQKSLKKSIFSKQLFKVLNNLLQKNTVLTFLNVQKKCSLVWDNLLSRPPPTYFT